MPKPRLVSLRPSDAVDDEAKFQEDNWIYPASDDKGHSNPVHFRVPPGISRAVQQIIASHKFPYKTDSDFYRHAVMAHLHMVQDDKRCPDSAKSTWKMLLVMQTEMRDEMVEAEYMDRLSTLGNYVNKALSENALPRIYAFVARQYRLVLGMPEGYWRDHFIAAFRLRFKQWLPKDQEPEED